jgi:hypothetical protein
MKTLSKLNFIAATRPVKTFNGSSESDRREKLAARIQEQINLVNAEMTGKEYKVMVTKSVKDTATGAVITSQVAKRLKQWYWKDASGAVCCEVKYGPTVLKLSANGKNAFQVASLKELLESLKLVQAAAQSGELDAAIATAAVSRRKKA